MLAETNFYAGEREAKIPRTRRRSLIERALVVSRSRQLHRRLSRSTTTGATSADTACTTCSQDGDNCCPICLREFDDRIDDICRPISCRQHFFHKDCVSDWLLRHDSCPLCRSAVLGSSLTERPALGSSRRRILWTQSSMWNEVAGAASVHTSAAQ
mmetsp:Transcript_40125/g.82544  ORF Transcript_40125/g.82544 Transcript_40125/m.82544 type:complete len:156 (-) Transcript_40125:891-1358(-)